MLFSIHTDQHIKEAKGTSGYSYGYQRIEKHFSNFSFNNKKLNIKHNSPSSKAQMFYMEPEWYNLLNMQDQRPAGFKKFHNHQYKIIGTHLETTKVWDHWIDAMNSVDEIWVGNYFAQKSCIDSGVTTPVYVFEHGIDDMWKPFLRGRNDKVRFLHVDSDSPRKRADLVAKAFVEAFGDSQNVELTLKYHGSSMFNVMDLFNRQDKSVTHSPNIKQIHKTLSHDEMIDLYNSHDVLVYPSEGEGFGFIPLQALATGMPVISTSRWCSYDKFLGDNIIESTLGPTSHTGYHTGDVVLADFKSLVKLMKKVFNNIEKECLFYYQQSSQVYDEYNWQTRCNSFLNEFVKRVGADIFDVNNDFSHLELVLIKYIGNGSYSTQNRVKFDKDNRIHEVTKEEANSLILTEAFEII